MIAVCGSTARAAFAAPGGVAVIADPAPAPGDPASSRTPMMPRVLASRMGSGLTFTARSQRASHPLSSR